jgi:prophage antirepressor-like protein
MTTEVLMAKTGRYLRGESVPAETRQIQAWLSCTTNKNILPLQEQELIEKEIVADIHAYIEYTEFQPKEKRWWQKIKITAFF